ncbi:MAG: endonuclease/exonuclease/phosphatase family protein [Cytophagales bacterium]|nr:endonuclease/exonuclease/phosphatase family protein [Cytophagales bacterium]
MFKLLYKLFLFLTALIYLSTFFSPGWIWFLGLSSFLIPVLLFIHVVSFIFWTLIRGKFSIYLTIGFIMSIPYLLLTVSWHPQEQNPQGISVLSYNVRVFNVYKHLNNNFASSKKMIDWVRQDTSAIKCFQEFHNQKNSPIFNTVDIISNGGEYESYVKPQVINHKGDEFGLAIFSKYPVINKGMVVFEQSDSNNSAIYADVVYGHDTIRIYNAHLESMSINENSILSRAGLSNELDNLMERLREGMTVRANQVNDLMRHIENSPYHVILCCDLNELPYSYVYGHIKKKLANSFEKGGKGFGFSYNGKIPFLRIDNQFFSSGLEVLKYKTSRKANYSDHYPIKCVYGIKKDSE